MMEKLVLKQLGYPDDATADALVLAQVRRALQDVEQQANFQYVYASYNESLEFLSNEGYQQYMAGADGFLLCATTLGVQVDKFLKRLQMTDMSYAVIFDAAASVFLENAADKFESTLPFSNLGYRFCPGYTGTPLQDNRSIAELLHAQRIGITFLDSGLMVPMKSMVGIIRIGGTSRKSCAGCIASSNCTFRQRGTTCWSENR